MHQSGRSPRSCCAATRVRHSFCAKPNEFFRGWQLAQTGFFGVAQSARLNGACHHPRTGLRSNPVFGRHGTASAIVSKSSLFACC